MAITRPPRTAGHAQRDALIQQFADAGLVPVISTNGGIPHADIQVTKALLDEGGKHGEILSAHLTDLGEQRLLMAASDPVHTR